MLTLIKETSFDFIGRRKIGFIISLVTLVIGLGSIAFRGGLRLGVEFTGGVQLEVAIAGTTAADIAGIRTAVSAAGYDNRSIQRVVSGDRASFLIHLPTTEAATSAASAGAEAARTVAATSADAILQALRQHFPDKTVTLLSLDSIGPKVGSELRLAALQAVLLSILLILIYIAWRFEWLFGVATVIALSHDLLLTLGLFSLFNKEVSLSIVAAFLTLAGYSVNDTIVIFDRIREELKLKQRRESVDNIFNGAINKTLSRTLLTSTTTMLVLISLLFYGGDVIYDFAWVLAIGIVVGTYSSVFVAAPLVIEWYHRTAKAETERVSA
ncbi:MAG TPA: protein translocase subunit SecF [Candidatus Krumholzibacteria bacterium]|nr:protein translocase subunit SecF [Candidatus Krumholzibacteria bacterium]